MYLAGSRGDAAAQNEDYQEHATALVQEWTEGAYGVTADDDEAWRMVSGISHPTLPGDRTYTVMDGERLLEVKLTESADGTFHPVQTSAELPLAEKD